MLKVNISNNFLIKKFAISNLCNNFASVNKKQMKYFRL